MKKINLKIFMLTIICLAISCKKEKSAEEEKATADIQIIQPLLSDTIAFNEELHMEGNITGSTEIHGYELKIVNLTTSDELFKYEFHEHSSSYNFHQHWVNNLTDTTTVKVKIEVELDHDGNHAEKEVMLVCLPQ